MRRPEILLWVGFGSEPILITDHHKIKVEMSSDEIEVSDYPLHKLKLLKRINLLILRLNENGSVAVDK